MKKKLFLRLCLMLLVGVSAFSCRTEDFHNEEETHGNTGLRLTSQRISLNQAKHRTQLLPDLEKAETAIEKKALKVQGKSVNIGNGITIDTDEVVYIENGPDYHTYTFSVIRDNASANAPIENILLTPNTDGSYRVFHIVLNLTEADKAKIANKEYVDFKNKEQVTELASISNLSSLSQRTSCTPQYYSYPVPCIGPEKHLPGQPGCPYTGDNRAHWVTGVFWDCQYVAEPVDHVIAPPEAGPGGNDNNTNPGTPPDDCSTTATNPSQVGLVSSTGCNIGVPTETIVRPSQMPCTKIVTESTKAKELLSKPKALGRLNEVKVNITTYPHEKSFSLGVDANGTEQVTSVFEDHSGLQTSIVAQSPNFKVKAGVHTHPPGEFAGPSAGDVYTFISANKINNDFDHYFTIAYDGSEYVYTITNQTLFDQFMDNYPPNTHIDSETKAWKDIEKIGVTFYEVYRSLKKQGKSKNEAYELGMAFVLRKYNSGIGLSKRDGNGDFKPLFVEELQDPNNPKKKTYNKTDNCNL